jgi:hypothetical protein
MSELKVKIGIGLSTSAGPSTGASVDQEDQQSLDKWCLILGVTKAELLGLIQQYGTQIKDIRRGQREREKNKKEKKEEEDKKAS